MKGIIIDGKLKYLSQFKTWTDKNGATITGIKHASEEQLTEWGFRTVVHKELTQYQKEGEPYIDGDLIKFNIIELDKHVVTNEELLTLQWEADKLKLEQGVTVGDMWFNEFYLSNFISAITLMTNIGYGKVDWRNINDEWVTFTIAEANQLAVQAMVAIQNLYKTLK